jgi:hypothetical protein
MSKASEHDTRQEQLHERLFLSLADQMKLPLLQIAHQAELASLGQPSPELLTKIHTNASIAMQLIDAYCLSVRLAAQQSYAFTQESVAVSSVLYDAAHDLTPVAKQYNVELELSLGGKYSPVITHQEGLQKALVSLGYALIEALPATGATQLKLQLAAHRCRYGIVTGLYADIDQLTAESLRIGRQLHGQARQPLPELSHTGGTGVFVADAILQAIGARLRVSHHHNRVGLGAVWQPAQQLQLV